MKIAQIHVSNFLGAVAVDVQTPQAVHLFAGHNGAGKSSLRDAIALALTADLGRVSLKKEAVQLITDGAESAVVQLTDDDGDQFQVTINRAGKITDSQAGRVDAVMPYVLDAQRLAQLDATARRAFLFGLMGLQTDGPAIVERLLKRGIDETRVERITPLLRAGFDAAHKEARTKATEAKGAWRTVTGETYGSEKAKTWRAPVPPYDAKASSTLATELQHLDVSLESWQQTIGRLQAEDQRRKRLRAQLPALEEHALRIERIEAKLATDQQQLADWEADLEKTAAAAGAGPRVGLVHNLAGALSGMVGKATKQNWNDNYPEQLQAGFDALDAYEREHGKIGAAGDPKAQSRLSSIRQSRDLMASAVANDKRDLIAAQAAKADADSITAELAEVFDAAELAEAITKADELKAARARLVDQLDKLKSIKALVEAADTKTKQSTSFAADVAAWDALADALAPDGIPGEMLAEALSPINDRLRQSAEDTGWADAAIDADMAVTYGGRAYRLLSESEQWRVDAMLAEAVASISGARLLVLDRFDVLDLTGRQGLLVWLDTLADAGEIDTALIFGTLKAAPANLPTTIATHWIENGVVGQLKEAA